jgi:glycyl-tRNA synthetase (class II)
MDDGTVTIRYRDTQQQDRTSLENVLNIIQSSLL